MQNRSQLINYLAKKINAKSYLEIGISKRANFEKINIEYKVGVDPEPNTLPTYCITSDEYFRNNNEKFDIIFIDGLHEEHQVRRDFENALCLLNNHGFIVIHDVNPYNENFTHYPRDSREWYGNVYRFAMTLSEYSGIDFRTLNFDCGCCVVWKDSKKIAKPINMEISWETFDKCRKKLLRLVYAQEFKDIISKTSTVKKIARYLPFLPLRRRILRHFT